MPVRTAVCRGLGGQYFGKCGAGWFRRFLYTNLVELLLSKKRSKSSRPLWGAANDYKKDSCSLWPHAIPAIAQLVEHLTVDCAEIRWSLAQFRVAGLPCSLILLPPPQGCLSALYLACPYRCLQRAREGSTLENMGRDDLGGFCTPILSKKRSKSSRPLWGAANDYKKDSCSLWPHAIPAIVQLVKHLTVDCAEIRWSLARFRVAGLPCSLILLPPPQAAIELCCLSALYLACPYRCLQRAREGSTLENVGRDDLGGFCTPILLSCSCQKKRSKSSRPLWGAANDYKKNSCSLWPHAIPAIAQLVEHLTVDCAEIRWSLARFRAAGLLCSLIPLPPPQAAIELCCLSALYLACPYRCLQRAREGSTLENVGRDDLGGFCTPILLSCSCQKKRSKSSRPLWGAANGYKKKSCSLWPHAIPAIAQLVEHVSVGLCRNQMVPGWIPGGRTALLSHPPATSTGSDWTVLLVSLVSCLSVPLSAEGAGGQYFGKCGAGWFRRFLYTNLAELFLSKKTL